jgi:hypothetical protein
MLNVERYHYQEEGYHHTYPSFYTWNTVILENSLIQLVSFIIFSRINSHLRNSMESPSRFHGIANLEFPHYDSMESCHVWNDSIESPFRTFLNTILQNLGFYKIAMSMTFGFYRIRIRHFPQCDSLESRIL